MPLVPFIGFFGLWARTQGPHDPLLPRGPMSCQSAPDYSGTELVKYVDNKASHTLYKF
ncbi:unnamed protein product, partial [Staurois parvus]